MQRGNDGILIFRDDHDRRTFLQMLGEEVVRSRWILHEFSLMGNHYHLMIGTPECTLSKGMHRLLTRYVQRFNKRHGRRGHLFEGRFKSILVEEDTYGVVLSRYIALNPVRARLCERPEQWEWSSYAARIGLAPCPSWLSTEPLMTKFGATSAEQQRAYRAFVLEAAGLKDDLEQSTVAQLFLGSDSFIHRVQQIIDGTERSEDLPRAQVHPGRPELDDVVTAVASTFDTTTETIRDTHGTLERRLVAYLAFEEGLVPLRHIARALGMTSAGGVSTLVARCRDEIARDPTVRELAESCRNRMRRRPPEFVIPPFREPVTARRYHRAASRSRR